jgi:DNA-binding GntR family transcriptional regulator
MPEIKILSKKDAVYDWLHTAIVKGDLKPGANIVIDELAKDFGISAIPIREALQQLEAEGFVVIKPYSGVTVTDLQPTVLSEVFAMLETAEVISGRLACLKICDEELQQLEALLKEMDHFIEDPEAWSEANVQFHILICACSGTTLVQRMMVNLLHHWDRLRRHYLADVFAHRIADAQRDHWKVFKALKEKDADRFEEMTRSHNRNALAAYVTHLQNMGIEDVPKAL